MRWSILVAALLVLTTTTARADEPLYKCREADPAMQLRASFKPDTSVADLAVWVLGFSCKNIVISADVPKHVTKVTILAPNAMSPKQALQLFVDSLEATGLTVTVKPDTIIVALGPKMARGCPDAAPAKSPPVVAPPTASVDPPAPSDELNRLLDAAITQLDAVTVEVKRDQMLKILAKYEAELLQRGMRALPAMKDGVQHGLKIYAIRPSSVFARVPITNGDTIEVVTIDGVRHALDTADKAGALYEKLKVAKKTILLDIIRRAKPATIAITLK